MEQDLKGQSVEWTTVVEYFTKRGRPLSKYEIEKLQAEDKRIREEREEETKTREEQEKRRQLRMMQELEEAEDFEAQQMRKSAAEAEKALALSQQSQNEKPSEGEDSDGFDRDEDGLIRGRHQYTKSLDNEDLRQQRISATDYVSARSNRNKGRYGVTIPKPFGFAIRDKVRPKSIRQREIEKMLEEKIADENENLKQQFRSKPIPPEVLQPRFQAIQQMEEERRLKVKQESVQILKQREAPFTFWIRDQQKQLQKSNSEANMHLKPKSYVFRANPLPKNCTVLMYQEMETKGKEERKRRIQQEAEAKLAQSKAPERMQKDLEKRQSVQPQPLGDDYTFKPKIGKLVTAEMFKEQ